MREKKQAVNFACAIFFSVHLRFAIIILMTTNSVSASRKLTVSSHSVVIGIKEYNSHWRSVTQPKMSGHRESQLETKTKNAEFFLHRF